jgi:hypothetical protein
MLWVMQFGSQPRGTWQFSMTHQTGIFTAAYSPIAANGAGLVSQAERRKMLGVGESA